MNSTEGKPALIKSIRFPAIVDPPVPSNNTGKASRWICCVVLIAVFLRILSVPCAGYAATPTMLRLGDGSDAANCDPGGAPNVFLACPGDCNENGAVAIDEIITLVNIVLGTHPLEACSSLAGTPDIGSILQALNRALFDCVTVVRYRLTEGSTIAYYKDASRPSFEE